MSAMKWFYSYFKKYQWRTLFGLILVTVTSVLAIVNPRITGYIVDDIIGDGSNIQLDLLPKFLLLMIGATLLRAGIRLLFLFIFETNSQNMLFDMRDAIYRNLVAKDFTFYNNNKTGDLMSRQTGDMMAIRHFVAHVIYFTYECVLLFCISLVMVFTVDWRIACAMLLVLPLTLANTIIQSKRVKPGFSKIRERFSSLNAFAQEILVVTELLRHLPRKSLRFLSLTGRMQLTVIPSWQPPKSGCSMYRFLNFLPICLPLY